MIRFVHFVLFAGFFIFTFYIDVVIVIVGIIVGVIIATIGISRDRFIVDFRKRELYFVIYKRLEGFKDCNVVYCLVSIY